MSRIAILGMRVLDQPDFDQAPLEAALLARGHTSTLVAWDDPATELTGFDAAVLRSTWNYHHRLPEFLSFCVRAAEATRLFNPLELVRLSTHKFYLRDLAARGVPTIETAFLEAGSTCNLGALLESRGWQTAVVKPAVSADSWATVRVERSATDAGQPHLDEHLAQRDMLVQEYLETVTEPGERCLVMLDGRLSHAIRKRSLWLGGRHAGPEGVAVEIAADEAALAQRILDQLGSPPPLYARVDLLRDAQGQPRLMELELVEPSLFFDAGPGSADRLVAALERRLA